MDIDIGGGGNTGAYRGSTDPLNGRPVGPAGLMTDCAQKFSRNILVSCKIDSGGTIKVKKSLTSCSKMITFHCNRIIRDIITLRRQ